MKMLNKGALGALLAGLFACDDAGTPTPAAATIEFVRPGLAQELTCLDDQDRSTDDVLEYDVEALLLLKGSDPAGLTVELIIDGDAANALVSEVPVSGIVTFPDVPLALGPRSLEARVLFDGGVESTARRNVVVGIDPADPACEMVEPPELAFQIPADGAVLDDSNDANLADGLQVAVELAASGEGPVTLSVNGVDAGEAQPEDGVARFESVTLPIGDGASVPVTLRAAQDGAEAEITVTIDIDGCDVELLPELIDGCWDPAADVDPDTDGVQLDFQANTNCGTVEFSLGGASVGIVAVADGSATQRITLAPGANQVVATATTEGGLTGEAMGDYRLGGGDVSARLDLDPEDTRFRADLDDDGAAWTITGTATGLGAVTIDINGATQDVAVGADGRFEFGVAADVEYLCPVEIEVSGEDDCSGEAVSETYSVCFDSVSPELRIVDPEDNAILVDRNPGQDGLQTAFSVQITDPRPPEVDYDIGIECGAGGDFVEYSVARRARSAAEDGVVVVPVDLRLEDGAYTCRAVAQAANNPPTTPVANVRIDSTVLGFTLTSPDPEDAPACGPAPLVAGRGDGLALANAMMTAVVAGDVEREFPMAEGDADDFSVQLMLGDGAYTVTATGVSDRGPVVIAPAMPIPFIVDTTPPVVDLLSPAPGAMLGEGDDANDDLSDCVQTALTFVLGDANATEVCWRLNGGVEQCGAVNDAGQLVTAPVDLRDGENTISFRATDCAGLETAGEHTLTTVGCGADPRMLAITNPSDGETIRAAQDGDPAADGCQIEVNAGGEGFEDGTTFVVCADSGAPDARCPGGGAVVSDADCASAGGVARNLSCPVTLPDGEHQLTVVSSDARPFASAAIGLTVDCTPPTVESLVIVEDDGDACVNATEAGGAETLTLRATVNGIPDGERLTARRLPGGEAIAAGEVTDGVADIEIPVAEGREQLYVTGRDAVGNPLPGGEDAFVLGLTTDLTAPAPVLQDVAPDGCLNAAADADGADGFQYGFSIRTGAAPAEVVTARLTVDDAEAQAIDGATPITEFDAIDLDEGPHTVLIEVTDACGNMGTIADGAFDLRVDVTAPEPTLSGAMEGQIFAADDDVDAVTDGLQVELGVDFAEGTGPDAGQDIRLLAGAGQLVAIPADGGDGPFNATVTLPAGDSALTATATDACGNVGTSPAVNVSVDAGACASSIVGFAENPAVLGPAAGMVIDGALQLSVDARVEPGCGGGTAQLVVDGAAGMPVMIGGGDLRFDLALAPGEHTLRLRVTAGGETADSPLQTVVIDLDAPRVAIDAPAGAEPIQLLEDLDPGTPGQQVGVSATAIEDTIHSARTARVEIDGMIVAGPIAVGDASPAPIDFGPVTLGTDAGTLTVCVADAGGNEGCASVEFTADAGAPGVVDPAVVIIDRRRTRVRLDFVAPGDDGAGGGRVTRYRVRAADAPILDEDDWDAARQILASGATADPGENQRLVLDRLLNLNAVHHIAVRAFDEADQPGGWVSAEVDLRMDTQIFDLDAPYNGDDFFNGGSQVIAVGYVNNDAADDVLLYGNQIAGEAAAALLLGGAQAGRLLRLTLDADTVFAATDAGAVGDVNGDGLPDFALLGYSAAFDTSRVSIYLGCDGCDDAELARPDTLITVPGRLTNFVTGAGNFSRPDANDTIDDLFLGGSPGGGGPTAFVVNGRADWPAELDATVPANGVITLGLPVDNAGVFAAGVGDLDGDGSDDLAFGAGGNFERSFVFYGGVALDADYAYDMNNPRTVELTNPCIDPSTSFGSWFAGGVDLDGVGGPDFIIGARGHKRIIPFDSDLQVLDCIGRAEVQLGVNFDLAGDLNGDGDIEIIATHRDDQGRPQDALVFYNDGSGQFGGDGVQAEADVRFTDAQGVHLGAAGVGDFNADGRDDVVTVFKVPGGPLRAIVYY